MIAFGPDCSNKFVGSLDGLFHIYHIAVSGEGGYKVSSDDSMHLVEALRFFTFSSILYIIVQDPACFNSDHITAWLLRNFHLIMPRKHWNWFACQLLLLYK